MADTPPRPELLIVEDIGQREKLLQLDAQVAALCEFQQMIGRSPIMQELFDTIRRVALHGRSILVTGEAGTGKELIARALHEVGPRGRKRFHTVHCFGASEALLESELFGCVRDARSGDVETTIGAFERAHLGTLFLDEVGDLPLSLQSKLLRAIADGEIQCAGSSDATRVDVCVIAATARDLRAEAAAGRFRSDLFRRLSAVEIAAPPLRERREDIVYLIATLIRESAARFDRPTTGVSAAAEGVLQQAPWPGNVRELRSVIERACLLSEGRILSEGDLKGAMTSTRVGVTPASVQPAPAAHRRSPDLLTTAERTQIERVLREAGGNKAIAARRLGISRRSLYRWLDRLKIKP